MLAHTKNKFSLKLLQTTNNKISNKFKEHLKENQINNSKPSNKH